MDTPKRPKVVVVMPAYNAELTLERTVRDIPPGSVDEVVLVDDCSKDRTVEVARSLGLRVPDDLSVIGFDNVPESALATPPLTTIAQPLKEIGAAALQMLVTMLDGGAPDPSHVRLPTTMVERASCREV